VGLSGCTGFDLDGFTGFALGIYMGGCVLGDSDASLKIICSRECVDEPYPRRLYIHSGWARGYDGYHVLYGVEAETRDLVDLFRRATGSSEGFLLNIPLGDGYLTGVVSGNEVVEVHVHRRRFWRGVFTGLTGCLLCGTDDFSRVFDRVIDILGEAIYSNDPLYFFRKYSSEAIEYERHMKYLSRLLKQYKWFLERLAIDRLIVASKPSHSNKIIVSHIQCTPMGILVNGPYGTMDNGIIREYLLSNSGSLMYLHGRIPGKITDLLRRYGLRVIVIDNNTIIWASSMKKLILSIEKISRVGDEGAL